MQITGKVTELLSYFVFLNTQQITGKVTELLSYFVFLNTQQIYPFIVNALRQT